MIAKVLLNLQVLHPHCKSEGSLSYIVVSYNPEKEALPRNIFLHLWAELCHMATSNYKEDWGLRIFTWVYFQSWTKKKMWYHEH